VPAAAQGVIIMPKKSKVKKDGTVQKIIKEHSQAPEKAEIAVEGAEDFVRFASKTNCGTKAGKG
jgi:hypothetical protein